VRSDLLLCEKHQAMAGNDLRGHAPPDQDIGSKTSIQAKGTDEMQLPATMPSRSGAAMAMTAALMVSASAVAREAVQPGKPAPGFSATDSGGKPVSLEAFKGKPVVIEWTNHDCPFVRKHYDSGTMQKLQKDTAGKGVVWLTVVSSAPGQQGHVEGIEADKLTADRKAAPTAVVLDPKGDLGRLYGATVTPHMFVIDANGTLAYMGAIDDKASANPSTLADARPYAREAIDAVLKGKPVVTASTRPYGCSIKYAEPRS
jgi:peroxiredoxin